MRGNIIINWIYKHNLNSPFFFLTHVHKVIYRRSELNWILLTAKKELDHRTKKQHDTIKELDHAEKQLKLNLHWFNGHSNYNGSEMILLTSPTSTTIFMVQLQHSDSVVDSDTMSLNLNGWSPEWFDLLSRFFSY